MLSPEEFLGYVDRALDQLVGIVVELGDDLANRRPALDGANSPYAILTHCLGVMEYWGGRVVADRPVDRDREAEFRAAGPVADLADRAEASKARFHADVATAEPGAEPPVPPPFPNEPGLATQGGVLMHVYEELAQHLGQLELTRDVLRAQA